MPKNKDIRKEAKRLLLKRNNLMHLIFGICLCIAAVMLPIMLYIFIMGIPYVFELTEGVALVLTFASTAIVILTLLFVSVPIIGGFFKMAYELYLGKQRVFYKDIFKPFDSGRLYFAILVPALLFIIRILAIATVAGACFALGKSLFGLALDALGLSDIFDTFITAMLSIVSILLFLVLLFLQYGGFFVPYFVCRKMSLKEAMKASRIFVKGNRLCIFKYIIGFAGMFVLSVLSLGTLFVVYTIPLMIFSYFIYSDKLTENTYFQRIGEDKQ